MPIYSRLDWIASQVIAGRSTHLSIGAAKDGNKLKIKICMQPSYNMQPVVRDYQLTVVQHIRDLLASGFVAMDRGHKHSDGMSEVSIWLHRTREPDHVTTDISMGLVDASRLELGSDAEVEEKLSDSFGFGSLVGEWKSLPTYGWSVVHNRFVNTNSSTYNWILTVLEGFRSLPQGIDETRIMLNHAHPPGLRCPWADELELHLDATVAVLRHADMRVMLAGRDDYPFAMSHLGAIHDAITACRVFVRRRAELESLIRCYNVRMKKYAFVQERRAAALFDENTFESNFVLIDSADRNHILDTMLSKYRDRRPWVSLQTARATDMFYLYQGLYTKDKETMDELLLNAIRRSGRDFADFDVDVEMHS
eukprot:TRINITY_DN5331_c0_g1_i1.p1 TRINITY_DN5331_c0_g1~~TRINITY_DN5331_c0_g1_i1.p1  ORF type:complete len:388 (-),score=18.61 TRINITY_DN5331_c0_g1_i1:130-1224(-)